MARLRRLTRARSRGAAVPLTIFGLLTLASVPLYSHPFHAMRTLLPDGGSESRPGSMSGYAGLNGVDQSGALSIAFWLITGPLSYLACAWWYQRRAVRVGLTMRWRPWAYAGTTLFAVFLFAVFAQKHDASPPIAGTFAASAAISPLLAIALGLLVLARVERSIGVAVSALAYGGLCIVMNGYGLGQIPPWIVPPYGGTVDGLINPAANLILLSSILLIGALAVQSRVWAQLRSVTAVPQGQA
ncbi:hypothetical protein [Actinomadura coerulea]|uniref:hypothetical protein n=1 Tax=Actinomadura coerulea TaxID=46159 RepID=UPI003420090C